MLPSYSSIYNLGHKAIEDLFKGPVRIEEMVDGSQISFGLMPCAGDPVDALGFELRIRSKGADINLLAPEGMFKKIVETVQLLNEANKLTPGYTYRGEFLAKPKHNCLAYDRTPRGYFIMFDITTGDGSTFLPRATVESEAEKLGFEVVPTLFEGVVTDDTMLRSFLETQSILGGQKIEGVVIKPANYDLFGRDKKLLMGKFVSEEFKEVHANDWKKEHKTPSNNEIISILAEMYATPARWQKALIHLKERGETENSMRDMAKLIAEVPADVLSECEAEIREQLFKWAWPQLRRSLIKGLPIWYKELLAKQQFETAAPAEKFPVESVVVVDDSLVPKVEDLVSKITALDPSSPYANLERSRAISDEVASTRKKKIERSFDTIWEAAEEAGVGPQ